MQSFNSEENSTNAMDFTPAFNRLSDPDLGFAGSESGSGREFWVWIATAQLPEHVPTSQYPGPVAGTHANPFPGYLASHNPFQPQTDVQDGSLPRLPKNDILPDHATVMRDSNNFSMGQLDSWDENNQHLSNVYPFQSTGLVNLGIDLDRDERNWNSDMSPYHSDLGSTIQQPHVPEMFPSQDADLLSLRSGPNNLWNNVPALATTALALPATLPSPGAQGQLPVVCLQPGCLLTFARDSDRIRHETAVHGINRALHLCPIQSCPRHQGRSYSRPDKVKEHLWRSMAILVTLRVAE